MHKIHIGNSLWTSRSQPDILQRTCMRFHFFVFHPTVVRDHQSFDKMSEPIIVSVDGDHGAIAARNPSIRIVNPNQAIVAVSRSSFAFHLFFKKKNREVTCGSIISLYGMIVMTCYYWIAIERSAIARSSHLYSLNCPSADCPLPCVSTQTTRMEPMVKMPDSRSVVHPQVSWQLNFWNRTLFQRGSMLELLVMPLDKGLLGLWRFQPKGMFFSLL